MDFIMAANTHNNQPNSVLKHIRTLSDYRIPSSISSGDFVPGDWVYMQNDPRYRVLVPNGYANGENALYMGRFESSGGSVGDYSPDGTPRFSGLGATAQSEADLKARVSKWFRDHTRQSPDERAIRWAAVNRPVARRSELWPSK